MSRWYPRPRTNVPPTNPGCPCTRCGKRPQAAVHRRKAAGLPAERLSWCAECRHIVGCEERRGARAKAAPFRVVESAEQGRCAFCRKATRPRNGRLYTHCAKCRWDGLASEAA